jgi:hypothetical protein
MHGTFSKLAMVGAAYAAVVGITVLMIGEPASKLSRQAAPPHIIGVPEDWSSHHLVYSDPGTYEQVANDPVKYGKWLRIRYDTRFILQQMKRHPELYREGAVAVNVFPSATGGPESPGIGLFGRFPVRPIFPPKPMPKPKQTSGPLKTDWSEVIGNPSNSNGVLATIGVDNYPAKYSFAVLNNPTSANCAGGASPDYVVYNTGLTGSSSQASIIAYDNLYSGTCSGSVPQVYWAYNANGATVITSPTLSLDGTQVAFIDTPFQTVTSCSFSSGSGVITCPGTTFTWTNDSTDATDSGRALYAPITGIGIPPNARAVCVGSFSSPTSCTGSTGNTLYISPPASASLSNATIYMGGWETTVQSTNNNNFARLVLLKWSSASPGTLGAPTSLTTSNYTVTGCAPTAGNTKLVCSGGSFSNADLGAGISDGTYIGAGTSIYSVTNSTTVVLTQAPGVGLSSVSETVSDFVTSGPGVYSPLTYRGCTAPCMTFIQFTQPTTYLTYGDREGYTDNLSSPFYSFNDDVLYVGDSSGYLHRFSGVFKGTPAETINSAFPATLRPSPDNGTRHVSNPVFDPVSGLIFACQYNSNLVSVNSTNGTATLSTTVTGGAGWDISEGPIVDPSQEQVYVFVEDLNSALSFNGVYQIPATFTASSTPVTVEVGAGNGVSDEKDYKMLFGGGFDEAYLSTGKGNLYVCGNTNGTPTLYQIAIGNVTAGLMTTTVATGPVLASVANTQCSPVTEIYNTSASGGPFDWIFAGVQASGNASGCSNGGCINGITVTHWLPSTSYSLGQMVVDNHFNIEVVTTAGTSATTQPTWPAAGSAGTVTSDGSTLKWTSEGPFTFTGFTTGGHAYTLNTVIVDSNNNLERVTTAGTAASSAPTWSQTFAGTTTSGSVTFTNQGKSGIVGNAYTGGTSGIVIDNTGSVSGASNIYFSTLGSQNCQTSGGTAGCAVQASQNAP